MPQSQRSESHIKHSSHWRVFSLVLRLMQAPQREILSRGGIFPPRFCIREDAQNPRDWLHRGPSGGKRFDENVMQNSIFFLHTVIITSFCASADKFLSPLVHPSSTRLLLPTRSFDFFLVSNRLPPSFWRTYSSNPPTATTTPPQSPHPLLTLVSSIRLFLRPTFEE